MAGISIVVESGSTHFVLGSAFILDSSRTKLIRYVGDELTVVIPRHRQVLSASCFSYCKSFPSISFERDSELTIIESNAFSFSSLKSITIPRHVQVLRSECFSYCRSLSSISFEQESELTIIESRAFSFSTLKSVIIPRRVGIVHPECFALSSSLSSISFETDSEVTRIESAAFFGTKVRLVLSPRDISFIAGNALPRDCQIAIADGELSRDLREWNDRRQAGSPDGFERMTQRTVELEPTRLSDFHS
jgi:hypothetical protein